MRESGNSVWALMTQVSSAIREWWLDLELTLGCTCSPQSHTLPSGVIAPPCEMHQDGGESIESHWV
jgi:hypothetical protein